MKVRERREKKKKGTWNRFYLPAGVNEKNLKRGKKKKGKISSPLRRC